MKQAIELHHGKCHTQTKIQKLSASALSILIGLFKNLSHPPNTKSWVYPFKVVVYFYEVTVKKHWVI